MIKGRKIPTKAVSERDDQDLVLFRDLHRREKDRMSSLLQPVSDDFEPNPTAGNFALYRMASGRKGPGHEFFAENDKNDYDWLRTPPATPLFPSLEMEANAPADRLILQRDIPILQPLSRSRTPPNLMTDITRSTSATRGRPTAAPSSSAADHINRSTSATRRQSCSPSVTRGRKPTTEDQIQIQAGKTSIAIRNSNSIGTQFLGSRMVDKLMNARSKSDRESSTTTTRPKSRGSVSALTTPNKMMSRTSLDNHIMAQETKRDRNGSRQLGKSSTRE
ncbi:hypothetical protein EZV62_027758 [Acer yangbiense]|uniref:Uncharacterized protein n=1 Tax=Acer yangbiense TaxID=1000413 RepID=A0A5C7GUJ3_9ROSI|nr:hypothetical protein EZV62_027758 [Acer yangbiense]